MRTLLQLLICALSATVAAADRPEPSRWIGEHPLLTLQAHDVPRTLERFAESPYADLAETPWGALLAQRLHAGVDAGGLDVGEVAASIERVAVGVGLADHERGPDIRWAVATGSDVGPMERLCRRLSPEPRGVGRIVQLGRIFAFQRAGAASQPAAALAPSFPDDCVELGLDPRGLRAALGLGAPDPAADGAEGGRRIAIGLRLDPIGVREHWSIPIASPHTKWADVRLPSARPELLAGLPSSALMGCTFTADGAANIAALACSGVADDPFALIAIDLGLARLGLPPLADLLSGLHGDTVAWVEDGSPYPTFTLIAGMDEQLARRILPILALGAGLSPGRDGTLIGFLGVCACEAGYRDGRLILTTHPDGVAGALARPAGFAAHADAAAALAEIPHGAIFIGASRSGAAGAALSRLALEPLAHFGLPQLATMPRDLQSRGKHGFIALRQVDDGLRLDAGGLLGGPCTTYAALGGAALATYVTVAKRVRQQLDLLRDLEQPPAEGAAKRL